MSYEKLCLPAPFTMYQMDTPQIFTSALPEVPQVSLFAKEQHAKHPAIFDIHNCKY
jgi:hypothetical protein